MKKYRVRYNWGNRYYESEVWTNSSDSALIWATEVLRGYNPVIVEIEDGAVPA
jgi:hypothetical protein